MSDRVEKGLLRSLELARITRKRSDNLHAFRDQLRDGMELPVESILPRSCGLELLVEAILPRSGRLELLVESILPRNCRLELLVQPIVPCS